MNGEGKEKPKKVPVTIELMGTTHTLYIRVESPEDMQKVEEAKEIIAEISRRVNSTYSGFTREKKLITTIFFLAWQLLREREKVMILQNKMRNLEILMEFMEKSEQKG